MRRRKSILYLVNRSILKDDIKEKIAEKKMEDPNISNFIDVKLYQELENDLKGNEKEAAKNGGEGKKEKDGAHAYKGMETDSMKYDCVVCDECHYFLTDSNYNVDTSLSFRWVQDCFSHKVRIFMSATIDDIMAYIWAYDYDWKWGDGGPKYYLCKPELEKWKGGNGKIGSLPLRSKYYEYPMEKNYKYIDIHIRDNIRNKEEIANDIVEVIDKTSKKEKWLIFVDSVRLGEILEKRLSGKKAIFISSQNKRDEEKAGVVKGITAKETMTMQIIIATSVLDNGINIKDDKLRNVILMADTETEFIQMLGRKRKDQENLNVYLYPRDKEHFKNRQRAVGKKLKIASEYIGSLEWYKNKFKVDGYKEDVAIEHLHIEWMRNMAENRIAVEDAKGLFNVYGGTLYLNLLAYQNVKNLYKYYGEMVEEFDKYGKYAFVKRQLSWLGKKDEEIREMIEGLQSIKEDACRKNVIERISKEDVLNQPMSKKASTSMKIGIKEDLMYLINCAKDKERYKTVLDNVSKSDRPLTKNDMLFLSEHCGIPYEVKYIKGKGNEEGIYIFSEIIQPENPKK